MVFSVAFAPPIVLSLIDRDGILWSFVIAAAGTFLVGFLCARASREHRRELKSRDGFLLLVIAWLALALSAAVPLRLAIAQLSFSHALFEAMAGLTTTSSTVLRGLDELPRAINLWRAELQWMGGLGVISVAMAVLPLLGVGGMQVYRAQATGPIKDSKLTPRFNRTAQSLWVIYVGLTVACGLALWLAGMTPFDALCHALTCLSLGGFSTHDANIGFYASPKIEAVIAVFMFIGAINVATHFTAWRGKNLRVYLRDPEVRALVVILLASFGIVAGFLYANDVYPTFWRALRYGGFNVLSMATDCGFFSANFDLWPLFAPLWMLMLSCLCASAGSTGGGIKMLRTLILFRQSGREIYALVHPAAVRTLKVGDQVVPERAVFSVLGFIHLYTMIIILLTFLLILSGMDFVSAMSAIFSTFNNAGPGLGSVGPGVGYASLDSFQAWVCIASMLVGRLEILVLLVPLTPAFWRE